MKFRTLLKLSSAEICKFFKELGDGLLSTFLHNIEASRLYVDPSSETRYLENRLIKKSGVVFVYTSRKIYYQSSIHIGIEEVGRARIIGPGRELNVVFWNGKFNGIVDSEINKLPREKRETVYSQLNSYIYEEEEGN